MVKTHLTSKTIDKLYTFSSKETNQHKRIRYILNSDLSNDEKQTLLLAEISINLHNIGMMGGQY
jgi:hypothetical protein